MCRSRSSKQLNQPANQQALPSKVAALQNQSNPASTKDDTGSHKEGSSGSSPRSEGAYASVHVTQRRQINNETSRNRRSIAF